MKAPHSSADIDLKILNCYIVTSGVIVSFFPFEREKERKRTRESERKRELAHPVFI